MTLPTILNVSGLALAFLGALALARPWHAILHRVLLRRNESGRRKALRAVERMESQFDKTVGAADYYAIARVRGHMLVQEPMAAVVDKAHQLLRRRWGLPERSLLHARGILDRAKIDASFDELAGEVHRRANSDPRDLTGLAAWLLTAGFFLQLIAAYLAA